MRVALARLALPLLLASWPLPDARADVRIAISNDAFTEVVPPLDDSGFTHDFALAYWRRYRDYQIGMAVRHRWLTEVGGRRREDLLEPLATVARTYGVPRLHALTWSARLGPTATGNLGGRWMQNKWHAGSGTGPTLSQGLQDRYVAGRQLGAVAGGRLQFSHGIAAVQSYGWLDGQVALSTGVSSIETALGLQALAHRARVEFGGHGELAVNRFHAADAALRIPGGYGTGWQTAGRVGVHVAWACYRIDYEYRSNEGGSTEPIGVVAFTFRPSTDSF